MLRMVNGCVAQKMKKKLAQFGRYNVFFYENSWGIPVGTGTSCPGLQELKQEFPLANQEFLIPAVIAQIPVLERRAGTSETGFPSLANQWWQE